MQSILARPLNNEIIVTDKLLTNAILLSSLFAYGGIAIHSTSKMLAEPLKNQNSKAKEMNTFFHLSLSHNLTFSSTIIVFLSLVVLELNHQPLPDPNGILLSIVKGFLFGLSLVLAMIWYTTTNDPNYSGRWIDLKVSFMVMWLSFIFLIYGIKKINPAFRNFDLLIPTLIGFIIVNSISAALALKKLKKGGIGLYLYIGKIKKKLFSI
jgi:hypothetical protein